MQESQEAQIQEAAKVELFERRNIAGASDHTTDQIKASAVQDAADLRAPSQGQVSGFSVKMNEKRAKDTKVFFQRLHKAAICTSAAMVRGKFCVL